MEFNRINFVAQQAAALNKPLQKEEGLKIIRSVADNHGMAVTSEIMDPSQIDMFNKYVDIFQIGARNMQNYNLFMNDRCNLF